MGDITASLKINRYIHNYTTELDQFSMLNCSCCFNSKVVKCLPVQEALSYTQVMMSYLQISHTDCTMILVSSRPHLTHIHVEASVLVGFVS